jgi:NADH-quinone oxidoreductase subunit L
MGGEQDIRKMGGLGKHMPITRATFLIGCLAISGIPGLSGFFSKDEILANVFVHSPVLYVLGIIAAMMTAFYMFRLYFSIFWGKHQAHDPHHSEGTFTMKLPLILLMLCTLGAGFLPFSSWIFQGDSHGVSHINWKFSVVPLSLSTLGILIAAYFFRNHSTRVADTQKLMGGIYTTSKNKFYIDEIYLWITQRLLFPLVGKPAAWFDKNIIDFV